MLVQIHLDHPHDHYTNLDLINGRVLLHVPNPTNVSSIVVKLEGESRTRLMGAIRPDRPDKQKPVLEVHKFLYKTQVLVPANTSMADLAANPKATFALNAGQFEYPFQFKIPLNMACQQQNSLTTNVSFSNVIPEYAKTPTQHVKATLPPSMNGFPGEAEIRYFVKVTVNRPQFFKENPRASVNFTLLPIEPPRTAQADGEAYARRTHQFIEGSPNAATGKRRITPRVSVDARLPNPAVLTLNKDVPLRLLIKNMSERSKNIYLQMLQIELIGYTKVRAHEVTRNESNSWILASMSNMAIPIGVITDAVGTEIPINPEYWSDKPIPNTVAPTFQACNISRFYELEVRVGIGYGSYKHGEDQLVVLPLRLPVKVYSGIEPPQALLDASLTGASGKQFNMQQPYIASNLKPQQPVAQQPITPTTPTQGFAGAGANHAPQQPYEDAPPSYEEAIGVDLPPINGYRGSYMPPPVPEGAPRFSDERKR
ncbi:arrestin [Byssothecium circinans]|uniref:Arrestin n=1 Tax=Byssothecium circinans TaxID=147558 RepID=A0A6A5TS30_9PLEO|nr:arrestin [Byssothecium circinans]